MVRILPTQSPSGALGKVLRRFWGAVPVEVLEKRARELMALLRSRQTFTRWSRLPVDCTTRGAVEAAYRASLHSEIVLGHIDDDGRLLCKFGVLPGLPPVSEVGFVERKRFSLDVVLCEDALLIRKDYRGDRNSFVREWAALAILGGIVNVPAIHHVDEQRCVVFKNLIIGKTLRELLVAKGASILHAHTRNDSALAGLDERARLEAVWARGRECLNGVVDGEFLSSLERQLQLIHTQGITGVSFTWGNVVVDQQSNTPWLIDLDRARVARSASSLSFRFFQRRDCEQYKSIYGRSIAATRSTSGSGISKAQIANSHNRGVINSRYQSTFLIATSWHDGPVSQQFRRLGAELASRGHRVVMLIDRHNRAGENHVGNPAVFTWPSIRPTRFRDGWFLSALIRHQHPDCLVSNFGAVNLMTLVGWWHRVTHRIVWHHTLSSAVDADGLKPPWKLGLLRWRKRSVWRFATAIAAVSDAARNDLRTRFDVPSAKCHVIYNSLEDPLQGKTVPRSLSGKNRILCVGRFHPCKGQDILLRALSLLGQDLPEIRVDFVGDGPLRAECEKLVGELGLCKCCRFLGAVPHEKVLAAMAQSDITVVPSRNEAFGLVALESLAMGTPVVASAVGGLPEILTGDLERLLVPSNDPKALARTLHLLLTDTSGYQALSARCRARYLEQFEQSAAVRRQADWLESIVSGEPSAPFDRCSKVPSVDL